jgi:hypothetical protein
MGIRDKADEIKRKAGQILQRADRLDQGLQSYVDHFLDRSLSVEPMDIHKDILSRIREKIATIRPGKRSFPFKYLSVEMFAPDEERQAIFQAAFVEGRQLQSDIQGFLRKEIGTAPTGLKVEVTIRVQPPPDDATSVFRITFCRATPVAGDADARAYLVVLRGKASRKRYPLNKDRIYIGRLAQVKEKSGRLVRRNDVVFDDNGDEINETVSRVHAHIRYDKETGEYRICDDLSAYGTRIVRDRQPHEVPQRRGLKLKDGDEVFFGEACVRFVLAES